VVCAAGTLLVSTVDAPWLPPGGRADVIRSTTAPAPASLVRLLLRRGDRVFCVPRDGSGRRDLPTRTVPATDPDGRATARALAVDVTGCSSAEPVGFVRNTVAIAPGAPGAPVDTAALEYPWPTPIAHFTVWGSGHEPRVDGTWLPVDGTSPLADRHWFPLVSIMLP
jgi:hypothetical protein